MKKNMVQQAAEFRNNSKKKQRRYRIVTLLAAIVVFCTTYALILPAITVEQNLVCELEEHVHSDSCYLPSETVLGKYLICGHTEVPLDSETVAEIFPDAESLAGSEETPLSSDPVDGDTEEGDLHVHTAECFSDQPLKLCMKEEHTHTESCYETSSVGLFALRTLSLSSSSTDTDLEEYVTAQDGGQFEITLLNPDNTSLPKDDDGKYIAVTGQEYKLTIGMHLPSGIKPGTYTYQLPEGLSVKTSEGTFTFTDKNDNNINVDVGTWTIDNNGLITFVFNEDSNQYTEVTISASMGLTFADDAESVNFVGHIEVSLTPPEVEAQLTDVKKSGNGVATDADGKIQYKDGSLVNLDSDFNRIVWTVTVTGSKDSKIIGNTLKDTIVNDSPHYYSEADMSEGVAIGFDDADGKWHSFILYPNSTGMTWTSGGWTYVMPASVTCDSSSCKEPVVLSDEYTYYIRYFSTTNDGLEAGTVTYRNMVEIDDADTNGWLQQTRGNEYVGIVKEGEFNPVGGTYDWTINLKIPAAKSEESYVAGWYIWDGSRINTYKWEKVANVEGTPYPRFDEKGNLTGNLKAMKVTITYNGTTQEIPYIDYADENDLFCYEVYGEQDENGVYYSTGLYIGMRCECQEDRCLRWNSENKLCYDWTFYDSKRTTQFCGCWRLEHDADVTITYSRSATDLINEYGGLGYYYYNNVGLYSFIPDEQHEGELTHRDEGSDGDRVKIPGLLKKELAAEPTQYNDYTASYKVTLNDDLIDFSQYKELTVVDTMSETLVYVIGTMELTAEDAKGTVKTLHLADGDFTVDYDANTHQITVVLKDPGPYRYTMSYDAQIVVQSGDLTVDYSNSVYIDMYGARYTDSDTKKTLSEITYFAKNHQVQINKTKNGTAESLAGAEFGLYAESGELIESDTTDDDGVILFETHVEDGIVLKDHTHYYIQEITAPEGYHLDTTKYWIVFCDSNGETCATCATHVAKHSNTVRILYNQDPKDNPIKITNYYAGYILPNTGGIGTAAYTASGALLISVGLMIAVYHYIRRRKEDKTSL